MLKTHTLKCSALQCTMPTKRVVISNKKKQSLNGVRSKERKEGKGGRIIREKYKHHAFVKLLMEQYVVNSNQLSFRSENPESQNSVIFVWNKWTRKMRNEILVVLFLLKPYWSQDHCELCSFLTAFSGWECYFQRNVPFIYLRMIFPYSYLPLFIQKDLM